MTNPNPFEIFAIDQGLTMTAESVPFRPGGDAFDKTALHFATEIKTRDGKTVWRGFYSVGSAFPVLWAKEKTNPAKLAPADWLAACKLPASVQRESIGADRLRSEIIARYKRKAPLTFANVLESLSLDWGSVIRSGGFEDWAEDMGMDTDSRKAESIFRECEAGARAARAALGSPVFEKFLEIEAE